MSLPDTTQGTAAPVAQALAGRDSVLASFPPAYFALVMATGIVSITAHLIGLEWVARLLLGVNVVAYAALWSITLARLFRHSRRMLDDLRHPGRGVGFLTIVAGTSVLGAQFRQLTPLADVAFGLWVVAFVLWLGLIYAVLAALTFAEHKLPLETGIHGGSLLVVVATESVCVLGTLVAPEGPGNHVVLLLSLLTHLIGAMLYFPLITLILYRWMFFALPAGHLTPPYWINMGALAITTLAGSRLMLSTAASPLLAELDPFLHGTTLFFWASASWWIPLLIVAGVWRHGVQRVPLRYDPQYWSLVFPLGMYAVATLTLIKATAWHDLDAVPRVMAPIALGAWALVFIGLVRHLFGATRGRRRASTLP